MVTQKENFLRVQIPQVIIGIIALVHLLVFQNWWWLIATYSFLFLSYVVGEGIFLHRYFSHKTFECKPWIAKTFTFLAMLGGFGTPIGYRAIHIAHHRYSDTEYDPHTPVFSAWNACLGWYLKPIKKLTLVPCKHLLSQSYYVWLGKNSVWVWWTVTIALALINYEFMLYTIGLGGLIGFIFLNFLTDFGAHTYGSVRFKTNDNSKNIWWLSWLTLQGSSVLQNNHHAYPARFHDSWAWYEIDVGKWIIPLIATKINYSIEEINERAKEK